MHRRAKAQQQTFTSECLSQDFDLRFSETLLRDLKQASHSGREYKQSVPVFYLYFCSATAKSFETVSGRRRTRSFTPLTLIVSDVFTKKILDCKMSLVLVLGAFLKSSETVDIGRLNWILSIKSLMSQSSHGGCATYILKSHGLLRSFILFFSRKIIFRDKNEGRFLGELSL